MQAYNRKTIDKSGTVEYYLNSYIMGEAKRSWIAYLLWFLCLLGVCGAHRFYVGEIGWGVVYLVTFGFCGVGQLIDLFTIPGMVRRRNLVDRALSEDLKNDAIRNATM